MTKSIQSLLLVLLSYTLLATGGQQRLSKKNIVSIFKAENKTLLLNDGDGNLFNYDGGEVSKLSFENDVTAPTRILVSNSDYKLFSLGNSIYTFSKDGIQNEILSVSAEEEIISASTDAENYYIVSDNGLYIIDKNTNNIRKLFEGNIDKVKKVICGSERCYIALKNLVIAPESQNNVVAEMPSMVLDLALTDDEKTLVLCTEGVYIIEDQLPKQLRPISGSMPSELVAINNSKRWLYLIQEQAVYVFDWVNSEVSRLGGFSGTYTHSEIDDWSNLWLSSSEGIWSFNSDDSFDGPQISSVEITDEKNRSIDLSTFTFQDEEKLLNVRAILSFLPNHEKLVTEWRTENGDWRPFKNDFVLSAKDLKSRKNEIFIRSKADNSSYSLPFRFEINNESNQNKIPTYWYLIFSILGGLLLIGFLSLFNLRSKQNEANLEIKKLKAENELLQSTQQIDQLKMNPHFIFNALTSINGLIANGNVKEGRRAISLFSKFLRQFLNQSQEESISIQDEIDLLKNYVDIELLCRNNSFDFNIIDPSEEWMDMRVPTMIIQPFIENSIIHAFGNLDRRGSIELSFEESNGYLVANIKDNGVGIGNAIKKENSHKSVAIDLIKKRLSQRDKNSRKSYVEYSDNNPGTSVAVFLKKY